MENVQNEIKFAIIGGSLTFLLLVFSNLYFIIKYIHLRNLNKILKRMIDDKQRVIDNLKTLLNHLKK